MTPTALFVTGVLAVSTALFSRGGGAPASRPLPEPRTSYGARVKPTYGLAWHSVAGSDRATARTSPAHVMIPGQ